MIEVYNVEMGIRILVTWCTYYLPVRVYNDPIYKHSKLGVNMYANIGA